MALKKEKKTQIIDELRTALTDVKAVTFVEFKKLSVYDATMLRKQLRDAGVGYMVSKKTLLKRALAEKGFGGELPNLTGQVGIAYSADALAPAREVYGFQTTHKENVSILGGVYESKYVDAAMMTSLATIPSREVLLSQIAYLLKSPMQRLAIAVNAVAGQKA